MTVSPAWRGEGEAGGCQPLSLPGSSAGVVRPVPVLGCSTGPGPLPGHLPSPGPAAPALGPVRPLPHTPHSGPDAPPPLPPCLDARLCSIARGVLHQQAALGALALVQHKPQWLVHVHLQAGRWWGGGRWSGVRGGRGGAGGSRRRVGKRWARYFLQTCSWPPLVVARASTCSNWPRWRMKRAHRATERSPLATGESAASPAPPRDGQRAGRASEIEVPPHCYPTGMRSCWRLHMAET